MSGEEGTFSIPEGLVEKIYEISGDSDKYKGVIMVVANESGEPIIYRKFDSVVMQLALEKAIEEYLRKSQTEADEQDDL